MPVNFPETNLTQHRGLYVQLRKNDAPIQKMSQTERRALIRENDDSYEKATSTMGNAKKQLYARTPAPSKIEVTEPEKDYIDRGGTLWVRWGAYLAYGPDEFENVRFYAEHYRRLKELLDKVSGCTKQDLEKYITDLEGTLKTLNEPKTGSAANKTRDMLSEAIANLKAISTWLDDEKISRERKLIAEATTLAVNAQKRDFYLRDMLLLMAWHRPAVMMEYCDAEIKRLKKQHEYATVIAMAEAVDLGWDALRDGITELRLIWSAANVLDQIHNALQIDVFSLTRERRQQLINELSSIKRENLSATSTLCAEYLRQANEECKRLDEVYVKCADCADLCEDTSTRESHLKELYDAATLFCEELPAGSLGGQLAAHLRNHWGSRSEDALIRMNATVREQLNKLEMQVLGTALPTGQVVQGWLRGLNERFSELDRQTMSSESLRQLQDYEERLALLQRACNICRGDPEPHNAADTKGVWLQLRQKSVRYGETLWRDPLVLLPPSQAAAAEADRARNLWAFNVTRNYYNHWNTLINECNDREHAALTALERRVSEIITYSGCPTAAQAHGWLGELSAFTTTHDLYDANLQIATAMRIQLSAVEGICSTCQRPESAPQTDAEMLAITEELIARVRHQDKVECAMVVHNREPDAGESGKYGIDTHLWAFRVANAYRSYWQEKIHQAEREKNVEEHQAQKQQTQLRALAQLGCDGLQESIAAVALPTAAQAQIWLDEATRMQNVAQREGLVDVSFFEPVKASLVHLREACALYVARAPERSIQACLDSVSICIDSLPKGSATALAIVKMVNYKAHFTDIMLQRAEVAVNVQKSREELFRRAQQDCWAIEKEVTQTILPTVGQIHVWQAHARELNETYQATLGDAQPQRNLLKNLDYLLEVVEASHGGEDESSSIARMLQLTSEQNKRLSGPQYSEVASWVLAVARSYEHVWSDRARKQQNSLRLAAQNDCQALTRRIPEMPTSEEAQAYVIEAQHLEEFYRDQGLQDIASVEVLQTSLGSMLEVCQGCDAADGIPATELLQAAQYHARRFVDRGPTTILASTVSHNYRARYSARVLQEELCAKENAINIQQETIAQLSEQKEVNQRRETALAAALRDCRKIEQEVTQVALPPLKQAQGWQLKAENLGTAYNATLGVFEPQQILLASLTDLVTFLEACEHADNTSASATRMLQIASDYIDRAPNSSFGPNSSAGLMVARNYQNHWRQLCLQEEIGQRDADKSREEHERELLAAQHTYGDEHRNENLRTLRDKLRAASANERSKNRSALASLAQQVSCELLARSVRHLGRECQTELLLQELFKFSTELMSIGPNAAHEAVLLEEVERWLQLRAIQEIEAASNFKEFADMLRSQSLQAIVEKVLPYTSLSQNFMQSRRDIISQLKYAQDVFLQSLPVERQAMQMEGECLTNWVFGQRPGFGLRLALHRKDHLASLFRAAFTESCDNDDATRDEIQGEESSPSPSDGSNWRFVNMWPSSKTNESSAVQEQVPSNL